MRGSTVYLLFIVYLVSPVLLEILAAPLCLNAVALAKEVASTVWMERFGFLLRNPQSQFDPALSFSFQTSGASILFAMQN